MIRRLLALLLLTAAFWLLTQGVAQASHCGEVNYDASQAATGDCGKKAREMQLVTGLGVGLTLGTTVLIAGASGKARVTAATGPAPSGGGKSGKGKKSGQGKKSGKGTSGRSGKAKAKRDVKSHARKTRHARRNANAEQRLSRRARRAAKARAAGTDRAPGSARGQGKNPPPGRTQQRVSRELNLDLQHEEGAVPTAGLGSGHSDWQSRSYQRNTALSDLGSTFVQPQINFAGAALGETSVDVPYPATPPPQIESIGPAGGLDPTSSLFINAVMGSVLLGGWGWNLVSRNIPPIVQWDDGWKVEDGWDFK